MTRRDVSTDVTAGPGGVMTDEVGVVTGDLTLRTEVDDDGSVRSLVQYQGADEWYRVTGAPDDAPARRISTPSHARLVSGHPR